MTKKLQVTTEKLVEIHGKKLTTTSLIIAENCGVTHEAVIKLTRKFLPDLNKVGRVRFQIRPFMTAGGMQSQEIAELDDYSAMLLLTHMRSNDVVSKFKLELVSEFKRMRGIISDPSRPFDIQEKRDTHNFMMDALMFARETVGKETNANHFANENLFCNRALTGKWQTLSESDLDAYDLRLLKSIRSHNIVLMQHNLKQSERKDALDKYVANYRAKKPRLQLVINNK